MIEADRPLAFKVKNSMHAIDILKQPLDRGNIAVMSNVNMRQLMIGYRKRLGGAWVEQLAPHFVSQTHQTGLPKHPIDVNGVTHRHNAVLGHDDDPVTVPLGLFDQLTSDGVDGAQILAQASVAWVRSPFLQAVVQVRQVAQGQRWCLGAANVLRGAGNPSTGVNRGHRPPELEKWERPQLPVEVIP